LAQYAIYSSRNMTSSHRFLIGPPLLIVSVFCFAFVLMQPHASGTAQPTASSHTTPQSNNAQVDLPPIPTDSQPSLTKLTPGPTVTETTAAATPTTTAPKLSSAPTANSQSTSPNNQMTVNGNVKLKVQLNYLLNSLKL
jgi:hypothetical protein